jgi:hypothetical protein
MRVVHMNVSTLNTSTMMEPIFMITNIEHQKWQVVNLPHFHLQPKQRAIVHHDVHKQQ